jgi:hypothetical protein
MRSLKSVVYILLFCSLASCTEPTPSGLQVSAASDRTTQVRLICESVKGQGRGLPGDPSCDDLCTQRGAVCTGFKSIANPFSCEAPTSDDDVCRCCQIGE